MRHAAVAFLRSAHRALTGLRGSIRFHNAIRFGRCFAPKGSKRPPFTGFDWCALLSGMLLSSSGLSLGNRFIELPGAFVQRLAGRPIDLSFLLSLRRGFMFSLFPALVL